MRPMLVAVVVALLSGCLGSSEGIRFDWVDEDGGLREQALTQNVTMGIRDSMGHVEARDWSDEGFDFRLRLEVRYDQGDARLSYDDNLSDPNSFRFDYTEAAFWAGRSICDLAHVFDGSWVRVDTWDRRTGRFSGAFHLEFEGACEEDATTYRVELTNGSFR